MPSRSEADSIYHVVGDELEMPAVNIDLVHVENARHLAQNGGSGGFYSVCGEDGIDIVGIDAILVDQWIGIATGELPQSRYVGAVGCKLEDRQILFRRSRRTLTRYTTAPSLSSLFLKQSVMPGISRMTVLTHVFSTMPTSSNLGMSDPN